jgi:Domain of unknown function (DUF397)
MPWLYDSLPGLGTGGAQQRPDSVDDAGGGTVPPPWRKSSYSTYNGSCVEVAHLHGAQIGVRDSKNPGAGHLTFGAGIWNAFLSGVKNGEFTITP